ncbi:MAG: Extracellular solute-binding protein family 5 [Candidatus Beckwithbacteria bacterium GW2011_GWB1_47_15]|uniref:Extracellular solute-binding protein family 5 n=1 Tax=Candidatus Beckwithbacteria bacterium GW2011_GWB1_47_15 TaxID=1618371 RepID=A0A0G1RUG5_9BACT|nr:MAG: family 5 extracellular solute-binding protein [Candidatus Beckwithbacteria bacterium GW2011_GWC1_49_16]KKU35143.1 MAG: Extracellular solute-binding protein family 5 [Candidatus Beckwithbacteria bacterium GW2011_GWA1_46_30]KKU60787.1 MAG: Extracellular solute-binding protein family 5 [Candidatus Beckwithbacteria bacterium GW2011_GWB1_47_15]KKU71592.1 MAG: Extracellular solute-binding protein family 5 [Candidatus Beckwithbacteria bacterium GW2011_GWA2_47_25]KKW03455.1 MAG: Extracellular s
MIITRPFRKPVWILFSFIKKHQRLILVATAVGIVIFLFTKNLLPFLPQPKPKVKVGIVGQYALATLPRQLAASISRGLTQVDDQGQAAPDLAESWETSDDGTVYLVKLKPGQRWSDGTPLVASDINLDIPDVTVTTPDPLTLKFELQEPFAPFLVTLSRPLFKKGQIGARSFIVKNIDWQGSFIKTLDLVGSQDVTYRFYQSNQAAWTGFRLGEVDRLENLLVNPLSDTWTKHVAVDQITNFQQYVAIVFNLNDQYLSAKPLRQALAYAIENKNPEGQRALSPLSPLSWAYNSQVKPYNYNSAQAQELFDSFAQEATFSGKLELTLGTSQSFLKLADAIAQSWEETLGVEIDVRIVNTLSDDFQALLITQEIPLDPDQHALWHSTQPTNISRYSSLQVDKLLEDGRTILSQPQRRDIYQDFQRFLVEDSPAIFLMHPTTYTISRR